jgi:anti-sigma factor RsiW
VKRQGEEREAVDRRSERQLRRLLSGALSAAEEQQVRRRLAAEPELAAAFERMTAAWRALEAPPEPVPLGFAGRVMAEVRSRAVPRRLTWSQAPAWVRAAGAAALVAGLALGAGVGSEVGSAGPRLAATAASPTAVASTTTTATTAPDAAGDDDLGAELAAYVGDGTSLADDYAAVLSAVGGGEEDS